MYRNSLLGHILPSQNFFFLKKLRINHNYLLAILRYPISVQKYNHIEERKEKNILKR